MAEIEKIVIGFSKSFEDFKTYLEQNVTESNDESKLIKYLAFFNERYEKAHFYFSNLNHENAIHLYGISGSLNKFFEEFDWSNEIEFYTNSKNHIRELNDLSQKTYDYYKEE